MKKLLINGALFYFALLAMVSVTFSAHTASHRETFLRANKYYKDGAYEKALDAYTSIPNKGSATWYNMANSLYHSGKYLDALVAYKRAYNGATRTQRTHIDENIMQTRIALGLSATAASQTSRWYAYVTQALSTTSLLFLQILFLLLLYGLIISIYLMRWLRDQYTLEAMSDLQTASRAHRPARILLYVLRSATIALSCATLFSGMLLIIKYHNTRYAHGVAICQKSSIFVGPDKKYDVSGVVELADDIAIIEKRAAWYKVKKSNVVGWMPAECVVEIE